VRNAVATLPRTLASVRGQRGAAVEHVVVDALSDDGTLGVIEAHAGQIDYYVSEPDAGLYDALNKAMSLVRGSLVCVLNADDWLAPDAAAQALRALARVDPDPAAPAARLISSAAWLHNRGRRRLWLPGPLDIASWLRCPNLCHNGVYATPAALRAAGPYDTRLRIVADTRWLLAAVEAGVAVHTIAAPTVHYVTGGISGDGRGHVTDCARMLAHRFPALSGDEVWTLLHAFYPWGGNLEAFADRCPPHLGEALQALAARHAADDLLQSALQAAGLSAQRGQVKRVRSRRPLGMALRRGLARAVYTLRDGLGIARWKGFPA
jgi:glycosyltransferase involved in cell wall biosynthesis